MGVIRRTLAATFIVGAGLAVAGPAEASPIQNTDVSPVFECSAPNSDGTYTAFFSYVNEDKSTVEIPLGLRNFVIDGTPGSPQPTKFSPGSHAAVFGVPFNKRFPPTWVLDFEVATANTTDLCSAPPELAENGTWIALPAASLGSIAMWGLIHRRRRRGDGETPPDLAPAA